MSSPTVKLSSGYEMPLVGFGLWKVDNATCADTVYNAIKAGYRLFDGACGTYTTASTTFLDAHAPRRNTDRKTRGEPGPERVGEQACCPSMGTPTMQEPALAVPVPSPPPSS